MQTTAPLETWPGTADAGLLVMHGVGNHATSTTLDQFVSPLLDRIAAEGHFIHAEARPVGDPGQPGGAFAALVIQHSDPDGVHGLAVLEAGWNNTFLPAGRDRVSPWVAINSPVMVWQVIRYHSRGRWRLLFTALMAALLIAAGVFLNRHESVWAAAAGLVGLAVGIVMVAVDDFAEVRGSGQTFGDRLRSLVGMFTLLIFQIQRALVLIVLSVGLFVFPILVIVIRLLAGIPVVSRLAGGLLHTIEALFTTGGVADMYAIVETQATAAAIHARTRIGLQELERMVRPGGVITVVAHSGAGPLGWWLLSEPPAHARQATARFRYRLITVGAALNWALRGFRGYGTPLDRPLVNYRQARADERTWWLNVYGTWDPVPHGPVPAEEFAGWETWGEENAPNRAVRNLGAPVPDEHGEYWRNQQEFVPLVWRAVVPESQWAESAAGRDHRLWSNCRLALLSALVRTRLVILAVPVAAAFALLRGEWLIPGQGDGPAIVGMAGDALGGMLANVVGEDSARALAGAVTSAPLLMGGVVVGALALFAYVLSDLYTNFFWRALGRRVESLRPAAGEWNSAVTIVAVVVWAPILVLIPAILRTTDATGVAWSAFVVGNVLLLVIELLWVYRFATVSRLALPTLVTWVPSVLILPLLLGDFHLGWGPWVAISALNTLLAAAEIHWFYGCIRSLDDSALADRVYGNPIGRSRTKAAPDPARAAMPPLEAPPGRA